MIDIALDAFDGPLGDQEAVAIAVHVETADGILAAAGGGDVVAGPRLDQVAARQQAGDGKLKVGAGCALGAQFAHELFEIGFGVRQAGDVVEQRRIGHRFDYIGRPSHSRQRREQPVKPGARGILTRLYQGTR